MLFIKISCQQKNMLILQSSLYFAKFCNFFIGADYLISRYRGSNNASVNMDEIMITGGLGFQINTKKTTKN